MCAREDVCDSCEMCCMFANHIIGILYPNSSILVCNQLCFMLVKGIEDTSLPVHSISSIRSVCGVYVNGVLATGAYRDACTFCCV